MNRDRLEDLLRRMPPRLARRYREIVERVRAKWPASELEKAVEAGMGALDALVNDMADAATGVSALSAGIHNAVAAEVAEYLTERLDQLVAYDVASPRAVAVLQRARFKLAGEITTAQHDAIAEILRLGHERGMGPRDVAIDLRRVIGLDPYRARIVANYRRALESRDLHALSYKLRDARSDKAIRAAFEAGKGLDRARIDKLVDKYAARQLANRAEAIARTEGIRAVHAAQDESWSQAVDDGKLDPARIQQQWIAGSAPRTRQHHASMRGQKRKWGETFRSGNGNALRYPCDPDAPGSEVINCRCARTVRIMPPGKTPIGEAEELATTSPAS